MPVTDLLLEGVELMLLGMGSVFVFLTTLVLVLKGMSRLAQALAPEEAVAGTASPNRMKMMSYLRLYPPRLPDIVLSISDLSGVDAATHSTFQPNYNDRKSETNA